jgi:hypothetical protein
MDQNQTIPNSSGTGDYGTNQDYLKKVDHDADMTNIRLRLESVESRVKDKAAIVTTIKEVLEQDRNIDPIMAEYFKNHVDITLLVTTAVDALDRKNFKTLMKKAGYGVLAFAYSLVLVAATVWVTNSVNSRTQPKSPSLSNSTSH